MKSVAEAALLRGGAAHLSRYLRRNRTLVLAYHNIVPHGEPVIGDRSLHLPVGKFSAQLDALLRYCNVIPLDSIFERDIDRKRPRVAITFDDAYRGTVTVGVRELVQRELPATIFVIPGLVGASSFWWDTVLPVAEREREGFRQWALEVLGGRDSEITAWAQAEGVTPLQLPAHASAATEEELRTASGHPGITFGSHTWSHPNLAALDGDAVEQELGDSLQWLRQRFGSVVPWLTYPYGMTAPVIERTAAAIGYHGAFRAIGGWLPKTYTGAFALPRLNVPAGVTPNGFTLRLAGILDR